MKEQFFRYISGQNTPEEFGQWLYHNTEIEDEIGAQLYFDLVSINLKSKSAKSDVLAISKQIFDWNEYLEWERIEDEKQLDLISKASITIDLSVVKSNKDLHNLLKQELNFPDFYGNNPNALWDAITGLAPMPKVLTFTNWDRFFKKLPDSAHLLEQIIYRYNGLEYQKKEIRIENM